MKRPAIWLALVTAMVSLIFLLWPGIDLWVSALFWSARGGFVLNSQPLFQTVRMVLRSSGDLAFLVVLAIAVMQGALGPVQRTGWRVWAFVAATVALGPGLLVNGILKPLMGRARPANIVEFGGSARFSPAYEIAGQCRNSCSFTSGEAAMVAALAIPVVIVLWASLRPKGRFWALAVALPYVGLGAGLRVAMGQHFLSDVVLSVLFVALIALGLYRVMRMEAARATFHLRDVPGDLARPFRLISRKGGGDA